MAMESLKVDAMNREEARINAIRERGELRRDKFLNARQRTIGVDVDALNRQIAEKEAQKLYETNEIKSQVSFFFNESRESVEIGTHMMFLF
jgi:hypothetical protein